MKKLLLVTSCLALIPLQTTSPAKAAAPVFNWTGFYIGANVGGGSMSSNTFDGNGKGAVFGGQAGFNYQHDMWVFGAEAEGNWSGIRTNSISTDIPNIVNNNSFQAFNGSLKNTDNFTFAGRAGFTFDRTLIYGKGGWAWGSFKSDTFDTCCGPTATTTTRNFSGTLDGFVVGAGIEHAVTPNWTVKLEYDFIGFGNKEVSLNQCNSNGVCGQTGTTSFSANQQVFKVGANYRFNFGMPPAPPP